MEDQTRAFWHLKCNLDVPKIIPMIYSSAILLFSVDLRDVELNLIRFRGDQPLKKSPCWKKNRLYKQLVGSGTMISR